MGLLSDFSTRSSTNFPRASRHATSLRRLISSNSFGHAAELPKRRAAARPYSLGRRRGLGLERFLCAGDRRLRWAADLEVEVRVEANRN